MRAIVRYGVCLGASLLAVTTSSVRSQVATPSPVPPAEAVATGPPQAQASGRGFSIVPSLTISETATDNSHLTTNSGKSDLITQVTPGIHVTSTGGRVKGFVDYSLTGIAYARNSSQNELQNSLNGLVNVEAIENWAFVDASANISQQFISAFGTRSSDSSSVNNNRTEVRSYSLSPYVRGRLAGSADYEARLTQTWTDNSSSDSANNRTTLARARLTGDTGLRVIGWAADASHQVYDYSEGRRTIDDRARGIVYVTVNPQLRLSLIEGIESNNIVSADRKSRSTPGLGFDWQPTERTRVSAQREERFFGSSHSYLFQHRTPRTVWSYVDTQDISTGFGQPVLGQVGTAYDLFFTQFASLQPDPVARAALVDAFLRANGIAPTTPIFAGSLASAVTKQRRQELSFAWLGIRDTVTFAATQSHGQRLDNAVVVTDDFANGNLVRQRGFSVSVAHRLTPSAALNVIAAFDRASGDLASQSTILRSIGVYWTDQLGPRSTLSVGARHSSFSSPIDPYNETSVTATLGLRF